jgi:hypothetical protein
VGKELPTTSPSRTVDPPDTKMSVTSCSALGVRKALEQALLRTPRSCRRVRVAAFVSPLRCNGMRSMRAVTLRLARLKHTVQLLYGTAIFIRTFCNHHGCQRSTWFLGE